MDSLVRFRLLALLSLAVLTLLVGLGELVPRDGQVAQLLGVAESDGLLTVAFLDVGQGDAICIETPDGVQLLIDGGPDGSVLRELPKVMPFWDRSLDVVLATHPDKDHIGGLVDVLSRYEVAEIISTENDSETAVSSAFIFSAVAEQAKQTMARAGQQFRLGASTTLMIYSPVSDPSAWESNRSSVVAQLSYGEIDFMLTGDAPSGIEEYLVATHGLALQSEVLKLGHHGSKTSTAAEFLAAVAPTYAVVSAGADNSYGHPHAEVMQRVEDFGVSIFSTAEEGTVIFKSDGERVWRGE